MWVEHLQSFGQPAVYMQGSLPCDQGLLLLLLLGRHSSVRQEGV